MSDTSLLHLALPSPRMPHRAAGARASALVTAALHAAATAAIAALTFGSPRARAAARDDGRAGAANAGAAHGLSADARTRRRRGRRRESPNVATVARTERRHRSHHAAGCTTRARRGGSCGGDAIAGRRAAVAATRIRDRVSNRHAGRSPIHDVLQGPGRGGGVGTGTGSGIGSGTGPGFGPGSGGGIGGGVYRPGNGVTTPTLRSQVRPNYTSEAMQRKIQGTVVLEMIVGADGIPYGARVVRSLDAHGLDEEAMRAALQWRFNPGRRGEIPVDVLVSVVIDFHIR